MNVKKLKELLSQYPEDIELVIFVHSKIGVTNNGY